MNILSSIKKIIENMEGKIFTNLNKDEADKVIKKYFNNNDCLFIRDNKEKINEYLSYLLYKKIITKEDVLNIKNKCL